jgi:hypothetical protein
MPLFLPSFIQSADGVRAPALGLRVALGLGVLLLLPACKSWRIEDCKKPQLYEQSQSVPALGIPVGLDPPNTRAALQIPALREPEKPRTAKDACLESPPKYANGNLMPLVRDKKAVKAAEQAAKAAEKQAKAAAKAAKAAEKAAAKAGRKAAPAADGKVTAP